MKILQYFAQRRINKALMKALASEVTAKLDDREFRLNFDNIGRLSSTMSNDAYAEALSSGMKRLANSDNAEGHDDNAQYVQLTLDGSPLADTASFGRPLSNAEVTARLDVTTSRITPEHPYVEFDDDLSSRLNNSLSIMTGHLAPNNSMFLINKEDALYVISLLEEVKKGIEE